jgi:hypothetical protein
VNGMQNRMDKYSVDTNKIGSRTEKNKELYEEVKNSSMKNYEIKSNISVIDDDASSINVRKVRKMLDERYSDSAPKRKSIDIPEFSNPEPEEKVEDTKEYDINAVLAKAKIGKNVDYNKERLKKVRDTQYEILNNLDLELKKNDESTQQQNKKDAEDNLMNLINTITELEIKNKSKNSEDDLLSELMDDNATDLTQPNRTDSTIPDIEVNFIVEKENNIEDDKKTNETTEITKEEISKTDVNVEDKSVEEGNDKDNNDDHIEKTLSKLDIDMTKYDDFSDISKRDKGALVIKIIIFIIIIVLVLGAVYILNDILNLGLF